jgi:histidine ammonia-lyase
MNVSKNLLTLLAAESDYNGLESDRPENLQDPYSMRCSPQILGV